MSGNPLAVKSTDLRGQGGHRGRGDVWCLYEGVALLAPVHALRGPGLLAVEPVWPLAAQLCSWRPQEQLSLLALDDKSPHASAGFSSQQQPSLTGGNKLNFAS